jgi:hypoxanthine phosphoribosyltransferase
MGGGLKIESLEGKHVILVEDIIDTGTTLFELIPYLQGQANKSIRSLEVCALLSKRLAQPAKYNAKYVGFSIPNHFIIGYGLDYNELYRDLKDIWVISEKGIAFDAKSLE